MRVGSWLLVAATSVFLLFILRHELADRRAYDRNDSVMHAHALARMDDALDRGEDPLDHWNTTGLGYPFFRTYPPLGHAVALAIHRALPGDRAPEETFQWVRVLLMTSYSREDLERRGLEVPEPLLLRKPFAPAQLLGRIREALAK